MKLKLVAFTLVIGFYLGACGSNQSDENSLAKKRIIQKLETDGMGMLKYLKIESIEKINDSTFVAVHSFTNPMFNKEVRITSNYTFSADLDKITKKESLKTEMKSEGEWVETKF